MAARALLLVGGMGTRLRSVVPSVPKPLAPIGDRSIVELLVLQLRNQGFRRLVMCTGYLADQVEADFGDGAKWDVQITYSRESFPAGTAGAVKLAQPLLQEDIDFLVLNGDSFMQMNFAAMLRAHRQRHGVASIALCRVESAARYGTVELDSSGRVTKFLEKTGKQQSGLVNAGVYVFHRNVVNHIPDGTVSLETDVFPRLLKHGVYGFESQGLFLDIGTPETYALAQKLCQQLFAAATTDPAPLDERCKAQRILD